VKIKDLKSTIISIPFAKPTFWPYGRWDGMTAVVIEIESDQGMVGLGESICIQSSAEAIKLFIDNTKPYLLDQDPFDTERIGKRIEGLGGWTFGRHFAGYALAGIDMALWDIIGKACSQPVYKLLGGKIRDKSEGFKFIHHDEPEKMAVEAKEAVKGGKMPFEGAFLRVPEGAGLGVELDREKMSKYHEMYQELGMFSVFGLNPEELRTAPPPLFPSY
jgi:L-alanine-DL-glutamate epimerase-like enolase superfamily enzyme